MKKSILVACVAFVMALGTAVPVNAQFNFGIKAGVDVDRLSFNEDLFDSDNRAGFTGGVMIEFTAPIINLGFDLSAMYVRRNSQFMHNNDIVKNNRDYIEIPLNLKYKLEVPAIARIIAPFVTTGPSVAFLTSRKHIESAYKNNEVDVAWNFGFGIELLRKVQLAASYGLGLTKTLQNIPGVNLNGTSIEGKNRYWTVTAAYLF